MNGKKLHRGYRSRTAFSVVELLVTLGVVALLCFLLMPRLHGNKTKSKRILCVSNLKMLGVSFRIFAADSHEKYPWQTNKALSLEGRLDAGLPTSGDLIFLYARLSNELSTPKILACPADSRSRLRDSKFPEMMADATERNRVPSYFLGLNSTEEQPQTILSGDRNILAPPAFDWTRVTGSTPAWRLHEAGTNALSALQWGMETIHKGAGNVLLGDGSVQQVSSGRLRDAVRDAQSVTNDMTWLMPVDH
jgi:prepilin-type processing-associated H-X9-DG protein